MTYKIIRTDDTSGLVVYEIAHSRGALQEQLSTVDYPTADAIIAQIQSRDKEVNSEVGQDPPIIPVPDAIKRMVAA